MILIDKLKKIFFRNKPEWKTLEYFDEEWKDRIKLMSTYIEPEQSIIDLGCGKMWLKQYLKYNEYFPVDYTYRGEGTILCDFNKKEYPDFTTNVAFVSGCLEYIVDYKWFIFKIAQNSKSCILSYCTTEQFPDFSIRESYGWKNDLSKKQIIQLFEQNSMKLIEESITKTNNNIFIFKYE